MIIFLSLSVSRMLILAACYEGIKYCISLPLNPASTHQKELAWRRKSTVVQRSSKCLRILKHSLRTLACITSVN